jgi:hypothetical protein
MKSAPTSPVSHVNIAGSLPSTGVLDYRRGSRRHDTWP